MQRFGLHSLPPRAHPAGPPPVHHGPPKLLRQLAAVQAGVGRSLRGRGIVGGSDRLDLRKPCSGLALTLEPHRLRGEAVPGGFAPPGGGMSAPPPPHPPTPLLPPPPP